MNSVRIFGRLNLIVNLKLKKFEGEYGKKRQGKRAKGRLNHVLMVFFNCNCVFYYYYYYFKGFLAHLFG